MAMSDFIEIINPRTMIGKVLIDGVVTAEYKVEQCDKCKLIRKLDSGGFELGEGGEKVMWLCGNCR
jgi:hypothetical protein